MTAFSINTNIFQSLTPDEKRQAKGELIDITKGHFILTSIGNLAGFGITVYCEGDVKKTAQLILKEYFEYEVQYA